MRAGTKRLLAVESTLYGIVDASRSKQIQLTEEVARFEASVYAFAPGGVRAIVRLELESRLDQLKRSVVTPKVARPFVRLRTPTMPRAPTKPRADVAEGSPADDHKTGRKPHGHVGRSSASSRLGWLVEPRSTHHSSCATDRLVWLRRRAESLDDLMRR